MWKSSWCVHREFSYESPGERILKIGPHLPKYCVIIKHQVAYFFGTRCICELHLRIGFYKGRWFLTLLLCSQIGDPNRTHISPTFHPRHNWHDWAHVSTIILYYARWQYKNKKNTVLRWPLHMAQLNKVQSRFRFSFFGSVCNLTRQARLQKTATTTQLNVNLRTQVKHLIVRIYLSKLNTKLYVTCYSYWSISNSG